MHFSEALRLGIGLVREDRSLFLAGLLAGCPYGCALGTAEYARGRRHNLDSGFADPELLAAFPLLARKMGLDGTASDDTLAYNISIAHSIGLSREDIADQVEILERRFAEQPVEQPEAHVPVHL